MIKQRSYYELVYHDGMTHSSYHQALIFQIWEEDKDLIDYMKVVSYYTKND